MASPSTETAAKPRSLRLLPYAQLLRIPNVFTAFADVALGILVTRVWSGRPVGSLLLALASGCLYCLGMVWNDWFDRDVDAKERPSRPLPSGRVRLATAQRIATVLFAAGLALCAAAGFDGENWTARPVILGLSIAAAILLYDGWLKNTPLGPVSMAACRFLNVLLGLSLAGDDTPPSLQLHLAAVVFLYIVGVTWYARKEAETSRSNVLRGAAAVMFCALALALPLPLHRPGASSVLFPYLLVGFGFYLGIPVARAIRRPTPGHVQAAVKTAVLGLILLDATLATALAGWTGLLIVLLLVPAKWLGKWVYST